MEHTGGEAARPYVEAARATFLTVIDDRGVTSDRLGFKVVPNGVLVDEQGTVRYAKYGGFSIDNDEDAVAVRRFLAGEDPGPSPTIATLYALGSVEREFVATKLRRGRLLDEQGHREEAVAEWRAALDRDPENLTIRKQIWLALYPDRFHPVIDWDWQREQLRREREDEVARGVCGPDGCPVPWTAEQEGAS